MASLYKRHDSSYWWLSFLDITGKRRCKSTGLKHNVPTDTRKAHDLRREIAQTEATIASADECWDSWVPGWLKQRYANQEKSLQRYTQCWNNLAAYLRDQKIYVPRQLTRAHVRAYIEWRSVAHHDLGLFAGCKNTALLEIKLLGLVVREAMHAGLIAVNPCGKLGIGRDKAAVKPRITNEEHEHILKHLEREPEWMRISYLIAWHQGCRLSETQVLLSDIDLKNKVIGFHTKGHKGQVAEFPLATALLSLVRRLKDASKEVTCNLPTNASKRFILFFRKIGLGHLSFHCIRITMVTRCYEAGIQKDSVMRLVGHASETVHAIYPRLTADHSSAQALRKLL